MIVFSENGFNLNGYLESIVSSKVVCSCDVARFDDRAARVVGALFEKYHKNPCLLPASALRRYLVSAKAMGCRHIIDSSDADYRVLGEEVKRILEAKMPEEIVVGGKRFSRLVVDMSDGDSKSVRCLEPNESLVVVKGLYNDQALLDDNEYLIKHILLVRSIVDHIAGMTDTYATSEYEKLIGCDA